MVCAETPSAGPTFVSTGEGRHRPVTATELGERVRAALTDAVRAHLVSDVPVSVFLSGGVDSATLAGLAAGLGACVDGITIGFEEFAGRPEDEVPVAAAHRRALRPAPPCSQGVAGRVRRGHPAHS